jgi:hypothetical protein
MLLPSGKAVLAKQNFFPLGSCSHVGTLMSHQPVVADCHHQVTQATQQS